MKKYLSIFAILSMAILAGCGSSGQNMTFQDAYNKLMANHLVKIDNSLADAAALQDITTVDFTMNAPEGFQASGKLVASGEYDTLSGHANINLALDAKAFEPSFGSNVIINALIKLANDNTNTFAYIDSFDMRPESGTATDGGLVTALIGSFSQKWINLTNTSGTNNSLSSYYKGANDFVAHFQEGLSQFPILKETGKTKIDGKLAYQVDWNAEGVSGFVNYLLANNSLGNNVVFSQEQLAEVINGILQSPIVGHIVVYSENNIALKIDSITTQDSGIISATYSTKDGLTWANFDTNNTTIATGNIVPNGNEVAFTISVPSNNISLNGTTTDKKQGLSLTLNTVDLTVNAIIHYTVQKIESFSPTTISGALLLEDILKGFSILGGDLPVDPSTIDTGSVQ